MPHPTTIAQLRTPDPQILEAPVEISEEAVVTTEAPPEKVVFTESQRVKLDSIIKRASATAGRAGREEAAQARKELAAYKAAQPTADSADVLLQLAETTAELNSLKSQQADHQVTEALRTAASSQDFYDGELAINLMKKHVRLVEGKPTVCDADGTPRLSLTYEPISLSELALELATQKGFLVRGSVKGGTGGSVAQSHAAPVIDLSSVFGPGSSAMAADRLLRANPAQYRILREKARAQGLVR